MEKMITRTIKQEVAICSVAIKNECGGSDILTHEFDVTGISYKNNDKLLEKIRKTHEDEDFKIISVDRIETMSTLYSMSVSDFIEHAQIISKH